MGSRRVLAVVLAFLALLSIAAARRKLLVFLLDGFRFDYIDDKELESLPGFRDIVSMGVKVDYMTPDFPSLSYPNYYTLMTGRSQAKANGKSEVSLCNRCKRYYCSGPCVPSLEKSCLC